MLEFDGISWNCDEDLLISANIFAWYFSEGISRNRSRTLESFILLEENNFYWIALTNILQAINLQATNHWAQNL